MQMTLVVEIGRMNGNDGPGNTACFGIPAYVIADFQLLDHGANPRRMLTIHNTQKPCPYGFRRGRRPGSASRGASCPP